MSVDYLKKRPTCVLDTECFHGYWSIAFKCVDTGRKRLIEMWDGHPLDKRAIAQMLRTWRVVSFNGNHYDIPMICLVMKGADTEEMKDASDNIIGAGLRNWQFYERYEVQAPPFLDHIDLIDVNPGHTGLKMAGARLHSKRLQSLPFHHTTVITPEMRPVMRSYVYNDCDTTIDLYRELQPQIQLRSEMSAKFGIDLRSKSDAQMAEALIKKAVEERRGRKVYKADIEPGGFNYEVPSFIRYETKELQDMLELVRNTKFVVRKDGYVELPAALDYKKGKGFKINIGESVYAMGLGGLHSKESRMSIYASPGVTIEQDDVTGYYPNMIIKSGKYPSSLGAHFQPVFQGIVQTREQAKVEAARLKKEIDSWLEDQETPGRKAVLQAFARAKSDAEGGKVQSNGTFGKTGSPFSILYAPKMMIQTTVGGQLSILMLIERFHKHQIRVVSANTDGIVSIVRADQQDIKKRIIKQWEQETGLFLENSIYKSIHARDVNNYIAIPVEGKVTRKGIFAPSGPGIPAAMGMKKSPENLICADAVVDFLAKGVPIETTIRNCQDITKFLCVAQSTTKGDDGEEAAIFYGDENLGKVVRWYYSAHENGVLKTVKGATVSDSRGAMPVMELPDELPSDIDYDYYIRFAYSMLDGVGVDALDPTLIGRSGWRYAKLEDQKTYHTVDMATGLGLCGASRKDRRDLWQEVDRLPLLARHCKKCKENEIL